MTQFVSIVVAKPESVVGLHEQFAEWAGESHPYEPRRFVHGRLSLELVPLGPALRTALPSELAAATNCLELQQEIVVPWRTGHLEAAEESSLRDLFGALERSGVTWAIAFDPDERGPAIVERVAARDVFAALNAAMSARERRLTIFVVAPT